jgi:RNA polymerase sigma-70 factor (ECF subfamily)
MIASYGILGAQPLLSISVRAGMSSPAVDQQLIERCRAGDSSAVETLVRACQPAVFRLALSILDDAAEADEAAQDALVAALNALGGYRGEAAFTTWLYRITINVCRGRLRRGRARERLRAALANVLRLGGGLPEPEEAAAQREKAAALWQAVQMLDEKHRLPLVLFYYHDLPALEIAQILALNEGTVHSRLHTARQRLRAELRRRGHSP